jgi:nitrate reductase gamma subunit
MKTAFLFQTWPYAAVMAFVSGIAARYLGMPEPTSAKRHWPLDTRDLFRRTAVLQISLFLLLLGHLAGLLSPQRVLLWNSIPLRLYALEILGFGIGLSALGGWAFLTWRHLRRSETSIARQAADALFSSLLFTTLLSGSLTAILFRWGSSWGVITLTPYVVSLLRGRPTVELVAGLPFLVRLHVFSAFATLAALPATRLAPVLVVGVSRGLRLILSPVQVLAYSVSKIVEAAARRLNPAIWIWPEDD